MAVGINRLSDFAIKSWLKKARTGAGPKKLADGHGLLVMVTPAGTPVWRVAYRYNNQYRRDAVGVYPEVSIAEARAAREAIRAHLRAGHDPAHAKRVARAENVAATGSTFDGATTEWLAKMKLQWSGIHYIKSKQALDKNVLPFLGKLSTETITTPMVANVIKRIVQRGSNETAQKVLTNIVAIIDLAMVQDGSRIRENPARAARAAFSQSKAHVPRPALLAFAPLGDVLRRAEVAAISPAVRMCHRLIAYTASRLNNAVLAEWSEFDLDDATPSWTIPREKMKVSKDRQHDHRVLLGPAIAHELRAWKAITRGSGFLFPSPRGKNDTITKFTLDKLYRVTLGMGKAPVKEKHSIHGWRASFATLAREAGHTREVVELTLDHVHDNAVARAYDRGQRLEERRTLMNWWDAHLFAAQHGNDAIVRPPVVGRRRSPVD